MLLYRPFSTDRIILAVYTYNNLPRVEQKVSLGPSLEGCVFTIHLWRPDLFLIRDYGTAHAVSEIITQADVRMRKLVRIQVFSGFQTIDFYGCIVQTFPSTHFTAILFFLTEHLLMKNLQWFALVIR